MAQQGRRPGTGLARRTGTDERRSGLAERPGPEPAVPDRVRPADDDVDIADLHRPIVGRRHLGGPTTARPDRQHGEVTVELGEGPGSLTGNLGHQVAVLAERELMTAGP